MSDVMSSVGLIGVVGETHGAFAARYGVMCVA